MFDELYDSGAGERKNVLETLSEGAMTVSEIAKKLGRSRNGHLAEVLKDLSQGGFVAAERGINPETGELRQEIRYRICDNYARFYLRTILPRRDMIENGAYRFESLEQLPGWNSILGLQFENMVLGALPALVHKLHLEKTRIVSMSPFRRFPHDHVRGCQIDCLIQTKRSLYVVEIKRRMEIGMEVVAEVERKIEALPHNERLSVRPVLVYDGHLSPLVTDENFFAAIISAEELFGLSNDD